MNILTFDIEDWFHLLDHDSTREVSTWHQFPSRMQENVDRILEVLVEKNLKATFFCLGWVGKNHPDVIRKIDSLGFEIGTHSYAHQLAHHQPPMLFREDLVRSLSILEDLIGKKIRAYRAPGFSLTPRNPWIIEFLHEQGIEMDSSIFPGNHSHGGFATFEGNGPVKISHKGITLKEFPISYSRILGRRIIFSGGGYFRLCPYGMIHRLMRQSPYNMAYFHPRDFDAGQPRLEGLGSIRTFKSYYGLASAFPKFRQMISDFSFVDLATFDKSLDWEQLPVVAV